MDLFELQTRANILIDKVNEYESSLTQENINEDETLAQQKYLDIYSLRPVLKLLFGDNVNDKIDRTLNNNKSLPIYASSAPMWNTKFDLLNNLDISSDKHEFMNSIDIMNNHNMIQLDATQKSLTYNNSVYSDDELRTRQGINYLYSSNIQDAVATESQIANMFKWNTTSSLEMKDNTITTYSQVPGIVMYYIGQGGFDYSYSPTISHSDKSTLNSVSFEAPTYNGSLYLTHLYPPPTSSNGNYIGSQDIFDSYAAYGEYMKFNLRMFIPGTHYTQGRLESPQQIWIPDVEPPEYIGTQQTYNNSKYNYQSHALYHELVFKGRRSGAKENEFDYIPTLEDVADNDPQGLATRLALAKNKDYYINRPWFNELDSEYDFDSSKLADKVNEIARIKYTTYDLNTTYVTNTDSTAFDNSTGIITGKGVVNPKIESLITNGTDTDSTNPKTKYISMLVLLDIDWTTITSNPTNIFNFSDLTVQAWNNSNKPAFTFTGAATKNDYWGTAFTIDDITTPNMCLGLCFFSYGTRYLIQFMPFDKSTQTLKTGYLGVAYCTSTSNVKFKIDNIRNNVKLSLKPTGKTFSCSQANATFKGDIGQIKEFDSTNSIDRLVDLTTKVDVDRPMTDSEFYNQYKLDYETYATAFDLPQ